jgi:hypothetical protein
MRAALQALWILVVVAALWVCVTVLGCGTKAAEPNPPVLYGPPPVQDGGPWDGGAWLDGGRPDAGTDGGCLPVVLYGPPPCQGDQDCVNRYGAGWYCGSMSASDGCGNTSSWAVCMPGAPVDAGCPDAGADGSCSTPPVVLYGPQP